MTEDLFMPLCWFVLIATFLSCPFIYRWWKAPRGIGKEVRAILPLWLKAAETHRPRDYEMIASYARDLIVWFEPPIIEEFREKAKAVRDILITNDQDPRGAVELWRTALTKQPQKALHCSPEEIAGMSRKEPVEPYYRFPWGLVGVILVLCGFVVWMATS